MQKQHTNSKEPLERHLFHGTTKEPSEDICHNNFDPRMAGVHGTSQGFGSYFATTASFSHKYTAREGPDRVRHMFLAKVLVGETCLGGYNYHRPPLNSKMRQFYLYDSCVDNMDKPTMFVVFDSCHCYPYYLIKYKDLPQEINIWWRGQALMAQELVDANRSDINSVRVDVRGSWNVINCIKCCQLQQMLSSLT